MLYLKSTMSLSYHCYADDTQCYVPLHPKDGSSLQCLFDCLRDVKQWMSANFLQLNESNCAFTPDATCTNKSRFESNCAFTPDATCANKSRYSRVVGRLNILSLLASFAREIHFTTDANSRHGRGFCHCKQYRNGGALNTTGILVFLIYFVLCDQQTNKN